jgi:hypothetical protein
LAGQLPGAFDTLSAFLRFACFRFAAADIDAVANA